MNEVKIKEQEEYKKYAICEYNNRLNRLRNMKTEYFKKIEEIGNEIKVVQNHKHNFCSSVRGHTFREELEDGLYGERYKVCTTCGLEV